MDTFDGSKPNLISSKTVEQIESQLDLSHDLDNNRVLNGIGSLYSKYIAPNLFPIIVILLLALYLTIKYILKRDREEKEGNNSDENDYESKKMMLKIDIDKILKEKYRRNKEQLEREYEPENRDNMTDISDLISDDYLLTDEGTGNQDQHNNDIHNNDIDNRLQHSMGMQNVEFQSPQMGNNIDDMSNLEMTGMMIPGTMIDQSDNTYNINKASSLIFGN